MLKLDNVTKHYGSTKALDSVSLEFPRGEIVGLFGENGAGKSTLFKSVFGFVPYAGEITLDGEKISRHNVEKLSFATCEHSFIPNLTAEGHREFYKLHFPRFSDKRFDGLMDFFGLKRNRAVKSFSTGQKNQFEVILAMSQGADYILMDEPFAGNDIFNREDFYKVLVGILEPHETVILSTHLIEEVSQFVSRAVLIRRGKIVGDRSVIDIEEEGKSLVEYVKETYDYRANRVGAAIERLSEGGEK